MMMQSANYIKMNVSIDDPNMNEMEYNDENNKSNNVKLCKVIGNFRITS